jgi:hypothetical protein
MAPAAAVDAWVTARVYQRVFKLFNVLQLFALYI